MITLWIYRIGFTLDCLAILVCLGDLVIESYLRPDTPPRGMGTLLLLAAFVGVILATAFVY